MSSKRKNIALFMAILDNDFSSAILDGAAQAAKEVDCNLFVFPMDIVGASYDNSEVNVYRYQYNVLSSYLDNDSFDGIIIEYGTIVSAMDDEGKKEFLKKIGNTEVILLAEKHDIRPYICVDNKAGLCDLITHLIEFHKCKKIGYISGPNENYDSIERLNVYKDVMNKYGIFNEDYIRYGNFSEYVSEQIESLMNAHPDIEAVVCANDAMALGVCNYFDEIGKEVGKDIIVTGFDDIIPSFLHWPSLTTVKASPNELSYEAVISLVKGKCEKARMIPSKLVVRESCGCSISEHTDSKKEELGITTDWRINAKKKLDENLIRTKYEHELSNITRELVFTDMDDSDRYKTVMATFQRLDINSAYLYLYDNYIVNKAGDVWKNPDTVSLVAHFKNNDYYTKYRGEEKVKTRTLFLDERMHDEKRNDFVMIPVFFGVNQIGLLLCETSPELFKFAFLLAGQLSNSLAIVDLNARQERMKRELEEISMYKSQFLANMSHEIRTPINAIIGFNEMILRESTNSSLTEYAVDVKNASENLLALVNDVLDFSKIEAGKMDIINNDYSVKSLVTGAIDMMRDRAQKKNLELDLVFDENIPSVLYGDKARINQVLINLLTNAVKYTSEGKVTLSARLEEIVSEGDNKKASVVFMVEDTGIGIKEEDIADLFVKFKRIEENRNRNIEGTGLGINIVSSLLNLMGSSLLVESTYDVGSKFYFTLTQKIIDESPAGSTNDSSKASEHKIYKASYKAPDAKILVVDDNVLNRKVIKKLLGETDMFVDTADSGFKCLELLKDNEYDLVLLDHMMPEMDGIETLSKIREQNLVSESYTKIIALTANAISGAKEMYLDAGFDNYLSKPVKPENLNEMIITYLDKSKII